MTRHPSLIGTLATIPSRSRRIVFVVLILLCAVLTFFPERYRAAVTLAPSDPGSLGLSGALGQLGAANTVFGNQAAVEVSMRVAKSLYVRQIVIRELDLLKTMGFRNTIDASRWLDDNVEVRSLRGGIVQIETEQRDAELGRQLIEAYAKATRQRLAVINRSQTSYKRRVLELLVAQATNRLDRAQTAYDNFRLHTRYSDPGSAIAAIGDRIPALQAAIKAKEVELNAERQFATDDNMSVRQIVAQLEALHIQLANQQALNPVEENSVGRVVRQSTQGKLLERELYIAQGLYDSYSRFLQGTTVEDLTANASVRILEPPFVDTSRQLNFSFLILGGLIVSLALAIEFYALRPPLEMRAINE